MPMTFDGEDRDHFYCLPEAGDCEPPYLTIVNRLSVSGVQAQVCTIREDFQTCEAVRSYRERCGNPTQCGQAGLDDARCEPIEFEVPARCTLYCEGPLDCPDPVYLCLADSGRNYCGYF